MTRTFVRLIVSVAALAGVLAPSWAAAAVHADAGDAAPPAPVVADKAFLTIHCDPKARVMIDDKETGLTTPITDFEVSVGRHIVKLVAQDGKSQVIAITLGKAGEHKKLKVTIK
jgi:hypothetical protein